MILLYKVVQYSLHLIKGYYLILNKIFKHLIEKNNLDYNQLWLTD